MNIRSINLAIKIPKKFILSTKWNLKKRPIFDFLARPNRVKWLISISLSSTSTLFASTIPFHFISLDEAAQEIADISFENPFSAQPIRPYAPCDFTKISQAQLNQCKLFTEDPHWAHGKTEDIAKYYDLHEETQLDRNLCCIATHFTGSVIHGDINQETLANNLKLFDIRKLLQNGPDASASLTLAAQKLIYDSLHDVHKVYDVHLHNMGYDEGNFLNPSISASQETSCKNYFTFMAIRYASGMSSVKGSTHEARKRLHLYSGHFPKLSGFVLPIHKAILEDGAIDWNATGMYLKNWPGLVTASSFHNPYGDCNIYPAISIHPFDSEWRKKLVDAHSKGIRLIKWMPPQSIPPDSHLIDDYYKMIKALKMTLIAHSGPEHTMPTNEHNQKWYDFGNPLRFRKALQMGVNVILAHCGHKDLIPDLDNPDQPLKFGHELFIRLAREAHQKNLTGEWTGKLYGDLAAVTTHYGPEFIKEILKISDEEGIRLIYGSDYPFTNLLQPNQDGYELCAAAGILDQSKVQALKEIRNWNPLLSNYIFTRNLQLILENGQQKRFPISTFTCEFKDAPLQLINDSQWFHFKSHAIAN